MIIFNDYDVKGDAEVRELSIDPSLAPNVEKEYNNARVARTRDILSTHRAKTVFQRTNINDASNNSNGKDVNDAFPNRRALTPFFADVDAFDALAEASKQDVRASFFVSFEREFEATVSRTFRLNAPRVSFARFGFDRTAPLDDCGCVDLQSDDARFFFAAPYETFLLFLCASLGFDVERVCRDEVLWRDLTSEKGAVPTALELETLNFASTRLADFFPSVCSNDKRIWRGELRERSTQETRQRNDEEPCYWEERVLEIGAKRFSWRLCFPFSNFFGKNASFPIEFESDRVGVDVEIARGIVDAERWKNLKPGDVLTTEVPADALFTVLFDGKPTFKARPGVFRGVTSVQLKEPVGE